MSSVNELVIDQLELQAAQYLPDFNGPCRFLHGHTYVISDIHIGVNSDAFLDFGRIKEGVKEWDHVFFVPHRYFNQWKELEPAMNKLGCYLNLVGIPGDPTVEEISGALIGHIRLLDNINIVHIKFRITEGLHQGMDKEWKSK